MTDCCQQCYNAIKTYQKQCPARALRLNQLRGFLRTHQIDAGLDCKWVDFHTSYIPEEYAQTPLIQYCRINATGTAALPQSWVARIVLIKTEIEPLTLFLPKAILTDSSVQQAKVERVQFDSSAVIDNMAYRPVDSEDMLINPWDYIDLVKLDIRKAYFP